MYHNSGFAVNKDKRLAAGFCGKPGKQNDGSEGLNTLCEGNGIFGLEESAACHHDVGTCVGANLTGGEIDTAVYLQLSVNSKKSGM